MGIYLLLLFCGLLLIGLEIFVPGGILGILGAAALIGAAVSGFKIFPPWGGWLSLTVIFILTGAALFAWIKYLPSSPIGKILALSGKTKSSTQKKETSPWKPGMTGTSLCELRPAGKAIINNQRADVIADSGTWIKKDAPIEVVRISGNHIYVKETNAES